MVRHIATWAVAVAVVLTPIVSYASTAGNGNGTITVPEPGTLALLSVGAGAAGVVTWFRGRRKK